MKQNAQQNHLLQRLPRWYDVNHSEEKKEPIAVQRARALVDAYVEKCNVERKAKERAFEKDLTKAKEAVFFLSPEDALKAVQQFEATWSK